MQISIAEILAHRSREVRVAGYPGDERLRVPFFPMDVVAMNGNGFYESREDAFYQECVNDCSPGGGESLTDWQ